MPTSPPEDVQVIARKLHKLRLEGRTRDDDELRRTIRNDVARRRRTLGHDLETARTSAVQAETRARDAEHRASQAEGVQHRQSVAERENARLLVAERADSIRSRSRPIAAVFGGLGLVGVVILVYLAVTLFLSASQTPDGAPLTSQIGVGTALLGAAALVLPLLFWPARTYWSRLRDAETVAERQLRSERKIR